MSIARRQSGGLSLRGPIGALPAPESGTSVKSLVIAALVTLIVAAAATFAILKLKGL